MLQPHLDGAGRVLLVHAGHDSVVPERADLPDAPDSATTSSTRVAPVAMPGTGPGCAQQPEVRAMSTTFRHTGRATVS